NFYQHFAAVKLMVEFHEGAVTQLPRRQVVILDLVGDEAPANRAGGLVAVAAQPLPAGPELVARVNRRERRGNPARLQRVRRIGTAAAGHDPEFLSRLEDGRADLLLLGVRTPD